MNKYGVCLGGMCPSNENIRYAKLIGFDYIELHLADIMKYSSKERLQLKNVLEENNMRADVLYSFFPYQLKIVGKSVDMDIITEYIHQSIDIAKLLGSKVFVVGSGGSRSFQEGQEDQEEALCQFAQVLKIIAAYSLPYNIDVVCEPISKIESNLLNTLEQCDKFITDFRLNHVHSMIDSYHVLIENDSMKNIKKYMNRVHHIHISNNERGYPKMYSDIIELFQLLKKNNYSGRISIEAKSDNFISDAERTYEIISSLINENH